MRRHFWISLPIIIILIFNVFLQTASQRRNTLFYTFRQENKTFYKVKNDPNQVEPDYPTPDNMFYWLNSKNYVKFRLWTRKNRVLAQEIKYNSSRTLKSSNFDKRKLTKLIIHGFLDGASTVRIGDWIIFMRDAYLNLADVNVLVVDYAFHALVSPYVTARPETVGRRVGEMVQFLVDQGVPLSSFHLIGWSWGAQIAGFAGHFLNGQIPRITGLDPAGPAFKFVENEFRLDKSDAKFVDVMHTNGGTRLLYGGHYGHPENLGHVDVWFNGGPNNQMQNGCPRHRSYIFETLWCSHGRAPSYFTETITSPLAFPTCPCDDFGKYVRDECACESISYIGEHIPYTTRGVFQVITRSGKPFGLGPLMNVSLPDLHFDSPPLNQDLGIVNYGNRTYKINFRNRFNTAQYPNNDILNMALMVLEEESKIKI